MADSQARPHPNAGEMWRSPNEAPVVPSTAAQQEPSSVCNNADCTRAVAEAPQPYAACSAAPSNADYLQRGHRTNHRCDPDGGQRAAALASAQRNPSAQKQGGASHGDSNGMQRSRSRGPSGVSSWGLRWGRRRAGAALVLVTAALCAILGAVPATATEINTAVSVFGPWDYELRADGTSRCAAATRCQQEALLGLLGHHIESGAFRVS